MFSAFLRSDYYGDSVALEVSLFRQSRIPSVRHVRALLRPPTHLLTLPRWYVFHDPELLLSDAPRTADRDIGYRRFPMSVSLHQVEIGLEAV
jgi:hypothetical protein